jgi:hypothetical protein
MKTKPKEMSRREIIYELAKHVRSTSPTSYHTIITWPTEYLRRLLNWYETTPEKTKTIHMGVDLGSGDENLISVFIWPFAYSVK